MVQLGLDWSSHFSLVHAKLLQVLPAYSCQHSGFLTLARWAGGARERAVPSMCAENLLGHLIEIEGQMVVCKFRIGKAMAKVTWPSTIVGKPRKVC